jgi:nucleotide-binding universal stress UspA family protein
VLVATDFSEESALALSAAVRLVRGTKQPARLVLFHAIAVMTSYADFNMPVMVPAYWDEAEQTATRQLEAIAAPLRGDDQLRVEAKTFRGYPAEAILHEAEMIGADLIALGSVGRKGVSRLLLGSVTERVLHHAACPVLAARRTDPGEPLRVSAE